MEYDKPDQQPEVDRVDRINQLQASMRRPRPRRWPKIVALFVVLLLIGGGAAYYFLVRKPDSAPVPQVTTTKPAPTPEETTVATKKYDAPTFGLSFNYPEAWTVIDKNDGQLLVQSSPASFMVKGQKTTGIISFAIRSKGQNLTAYDKGDGTAVLDSNKLSYKTPSPTQRAQTYLSYVQYPADTIVGNLDALHVTGDYGYQKGQNVPKADLAIGDPQLSVIFLACSDKACQATAQTPISAADWIKSSDAKTVTAMIESVTIN
ncbi:MAG: hypothetical protein JWM37_39 [Candidatus Saccharibacteria bacterium]|nr:hypothetical protein [Candidatus Saccharibacteria bacterium]